MESLVTIIEGAFTVAGLFTPAECAGLIDRAEEIGFEAASVRTVGGPRMMTSLRNNDRVNLTDRELAAEMWRRIKNVAPLLDGELACGVDESLRFYRYLPGQQFKRHRDGSAVDEQGRRSKLSYLIYLNDDCEGGDTVFYEFRDVEGVRQETRTAVHPVTGSALLFRHQLWHEGTPVTRGRKYVLRSDVFYSPGE